jgi:hypothetical protein
MLVARTSPPAPGRLKTSSVILVRPVAMSSNRTWACEFTSCLSCLEVGC